MEVVLEMPFLNLGNADIRFADKELGWRRYIAAKALPTTRRVLLDNKLFHYSHITSRDQIRPIMASLFYIHIPLSLILHAKHQSINE